ncbi:MAG: sulfurtransferase [Candidatus Limnocylindrales bacterium]
MTLISAEALHERAAHPRLRIADLRWYLGRPGAGHAAYQGGHLPDAIFLDLDTDLSAATGPGRHPLPHPALFAARLGALGIGNDDLVVAYDDAGGGVASRLWWMLDDLGHRDVAVLDGGIEAWTAAGFPLTTEVPTFPPARLELAPEWSKVIDREALVPRLGSIVLLDGRAGPRYRGETEPVDPVAGHIPTAISAPIADDLGPDGRFLSPTELAERFWGLGATGRQVVTSCGSGTNACQLALAMRIAGLPDPLLYPGSYSDWSRAGMPVATGPEPGDLPLS